MTANTEKNFCESGKHLYKEIDVVRSMIAPDSEVYIVVACIKCDSQFLRGVEVPLP